MQKLEIVHQVDAEEGYFGGEKIIIGGGTAQKQRLVGTPLVHARCGTMSACKVI